MNRRQVYVGLLSCVIASSFLLAACSTSPSEEQLRQLEQLKQEHAALEREVAQKEETRSALEREVAEKNAKLKKCNDDKQIVQARLSK
ncbi:MAG: hypothetical protein C4326_06115 [Ignavibacteria bacterium]